MQKSCEFKESDRLTMTAMVLQSFGVEVEEYDDGLDIVGDPNLVEHYIEGRREFPGLDASWRHSGDHRITMAGAVLELALRGTFDIVEREVVQTSFPGFEALFDSLS